MTASTALISGLVVSCVLLPAPMILATIMKRKHIDGRSTLSKMIGVVFAIVAIYCGVALGYGLYGMQSSADQRELGVFLFSRFLFFGGALVCLLIGAMGCALAVGRADTVKSATGLDWPGYLAGLLAAQAIVFFQQCNMQGVFQPA